MAILGLFYAIFPVDYAIYIYILRKFALFYVIFFIFSSMFDYMIIYLRCYHPYNGRQAPLTFFFFGAGAWNALGRQGPFQSVPKDSKTLDIS